jgi:hypothetical protein
VAHLNLFKAQALRGPWLSSAAYQRRRHKAAVVLVQPGRATHDDKFAHGGRRYDDRVSRLIGAASPPHTARRSETAPRFEIQALR